MGGRKQILIPLIAGGLLMMVFAAGCGSSSSASDPSAEFRDPKPSEKIATFGQEASDAEREAASESLEENLEARAAGDFKKQCATLSRGGLKVVQEGFAILNHENDCPRSLSIQAEPHSQTKAIRANTMTGPIAVLRVKGDRGWALYHGAKGKDYAMAMEKEGDEWKVAQVTTTELP
jgi:hypothetical protein